MPVQALTPRFLEKIWGSHHLSPWFPDSDLKIGEVWLEGPHGEPLPLLIKFLFTTERLSVQVHPKDDYARLHHQSNGKTEMWHILRAEPGARIALGLREEMTAAELRQAAELGSIGKKLNLIEVHPGETYFVPAGTIHAIGAGVALCEIQQQSDVTYRLYDYGRPRELHLDHGVAVSDLSQYSPAAPHRDCLVESQYFRTERLEIECEAQVNGSPCWLICLEGSGTIEGVPYGPGKAWQIEGLTTIQPARASAFLKTFVP